MITYVLGTRYFTRGIDEDGNVANNVETEQTIIYNGNKSSFVQVSWMLIFSKKTK